MNPWCQVCENMTYTSIGEQGIVQFCRNCGMETPSEKEEGTKTFKVHRRVIKQTTSAEATIADLVANPFLENDPTLPRMRVKCFNDQCKSTEKTIVRLDAVNKKYMCCCAECGVRWSGTTELR
jgi:hypothetical protein